MGNFKYKLKEAEKPKVGDVDIQNGTKYTIKSIDPDTGAIEWAVEKVADFTKVYKDLETTKNDLDKLKSMDQVRDDIKIKEVSNLVTKAFNEYRTNLRKNYPEEFATIQRVSEESTTGTGASFTSGTSGENYATKYAFGKYKYKLAPKKTLKEAEFSVDQYISDLNVPNPQLVNWIRERLEAFNKLEQQLNTLVPLIQQAKQDTIKTYSQNPNFSVIYGTDMAQDYLNDLIDLFKKQ
jgi:hypothetical protein